MKCKKLVKGLMVMGIMVGLVAPVVTRADTGGGPSYDNRKVMLKAMDDPSTVSVDLEWGDLQFEYTYQGNGEGRWDALPNSNDSQRKSSIVRVVNRSAFDMSARLQFTSSIPGVTSSFAVYDLKEGVGTCENAKDKIASSTAWSSSKQSGPYEYKTDPMATVIYSDSNCQVQVPNGEMYDDSKTYYYVKLDSNFEGATATANSVGGVIPGVDKHYTGNVVGSQYDSTKLASMNDFELELSHGDYSYIKEVYNSNKTIGTLDIWLYNGD